MVQQIKGEDVGVIEPTLGFNIDTLEYGDHAVTIWDIGGQKAIRTYWRNYFEATDGIIWVVDSSDVHRLDDCQQELHALLGEERLQGATLLILCNKQDLSGAMTATAIRDRLSLGRMHNRHYRVAACSAMTGAGLEDSIKWLVEDIGSRVFVQD